MDHESMMCGSLILNCCPHNSHRESRLQGKKVYSRVNVKLGSEVLAKSFKLLYATMPCWLLIGIINFTDCLMQFTI